MGVFKYINLPVFILSLLIGIFAVYITTPDTRKIMVYPTPENVHLLQYRDKANNCFSFTETEVPCPKDKKDITLIPPQS
jgi:hypothetical protein